MGWGGYVSRDNDIIDERMANKQYREYDRWTRETDVASDYYRIMREMDVASNYFKITQKEYIVDKTTSDAERINADVLIRRLSELEYIKDVLSFKTNLALSVANSLTDYTMKSFAKSMAVVLEDSYSKVTEMVNRYKQNLSIKSKKDFDKNEIKRNLILNIFYKTGHIINMEEEISFEEMKSFEENLRKLIGWFYDDNIGMGKIRNIDIDDHHVEGFIERELEMKVIKCPHCSSKTVNELKYCVSCARKI